LKIQIKKEKDSFEEQKNVVKKENELFNQDY